MQNDLMLQKTGLSLRINGDPDNLLEFDPDDILFVERYKNLLIAFDEKGKEYTKNYDEIDKKEKENPGANHGLSKEKITLAKESSIFIRDQIDSVFGAGASQKLFGDSLSMTKFANFFDAITPFIKKARDEKMAKYKNTPEGKKRVMK